MEGSKATRRLLRSRDDRILAGVCGGLGEHLNIDPVLFRIGFTIALVFGIGVVAYLALYVFVPSESVDENAQPEHADDSTRLVAGVIAAILLMSMSGGFLPSIGFDAGPFWGIVWLIFWVVVLVAVTFGAVVAWRRLSDRRRSPEAPAKPEWTGFRVLALIALIIAMLTLATILAALGAWIAATGGFWFFAITGLVALTLLVLGLLRRKSRWLLVPALALAIPLFAFEISGIEIRGGYGDRHVIPPSVAAVSEDGYELAGGDLLIDLRNLRWTDDTVVDLDVVVGIGRASILVPADVCVAAETRAKVGAISVRGDSEAGLAIDQSIETTAPDLPTLRLDGSVEVGMIQVVTEAPDDDWATESERWRHEDEPSQPRECFEG